MTEMEGMLYKWTNYLAGWQPRWFVLDKGILAYYKSKEEISQGSKGSVKMACCEIQVHPSDGNRLDLIIPGEQHFYVRGSSPAERQQWLVALGSAKACLTDFKLNPKQGVSHHSLRTKMSELRLYCDLLMQQVASVRAATEIPDKPDIEKLSGSTSLLTATCDTFINTLQDCMEAANEIYTPHIKNTVTSETVVPPSPAPYPVEKGKKIITKSHSVDDRYTPPPNRSGVQTKYRNLEEIASRPRTLYSRQRIHSGGTRSTSAPSTPSDVINTSGHYTLNMDSNLDVDQPLTTVTLETLGLRDTNANVTANGSAGSRTTDGYPQKRCSPTTNPTLLEIAKDHRLLQEEARVPTFFSTMATSFVDIQLGSDGSIPTAVFLEACVSIVSIFDTFNSTAFAPVKMDINGNIRKLRQKFASDTQGFATLQNIVEQEKKSQTTMVKNSATDALMWLRRALEFIREFLVEIINGETDLCQAAVTAYSKSLKPYHGWVVRGVFALAAKALPTYDNFLSFMLVDQSVDMSSEGVCAIKKDMEMCATAMGVVINILQQYYMQADLEVEEIV